MSKCYIKVLFGKELFILFAASAFRKLSSIYVFSYFPFGFEGRIWDLIVSVPDHCLSFYFPREVIFVGIIPGYPFLEKTLIGALWLYVFICTFIFIVM